MLKIMNGFLPNLDDLHLNKLPNATFQGHAILNVKLITQFGNGCVFSALVDDDLTLYNQNFHSLDTATILNVSFSIPQPRQPIKSRGAIVDPKEIKKHQKKCIRRLNNLSLNTKNWRQFIGAKTSIITSVTRTLSVI